MPTNQSIHPSSVRELLPLNLGFPRRLWMPWVHAPSQICRNFGRKLTQEYAEHVIAGVIPPPASSPLPQESPVTCDTDELRVCRGAHGTFLEQVDEMLGGYGFVFVRTTGCGDQTRCEQGHDHRRDTQGLEMSHLVSHSEVFRPSVSSSRYLPLENARCDLEW